MPFAGMPTRAAHWSPTPPRTAVAQIFAGSRRSVTHGSVLLSWTRRGPRICFHPDLPTWAMDAGADVCVTSIHKMGGGLEQGSVFHLQGDLIAPSVLMSRADLLGTTSPSVLIYAALDGWRRQMVLHGRALLDSALQLAAHVRADIEKIPGLHVLGREDFVATGLAADIDLLPVVIYVSGLGTTGYRAADWLRSRRSIDMHLADHRRISAQITHADSAATTASLLDALRDLAEHTKELAGAPVIEVPAGQELRLEQTCLPRDAFFGEVEEYPWKRLSDGSPLK